MILETNMINSLKTSLIILFILKSEILAILKNNFFINQLTDEALKENNKILTEEIENIELNHVVMSSDKEFPLSFVCAFKAFNISFNFQYEIDRENHATLTNYFKNYKSSLIQLKNMDKSSDKDVRYLSISIFYFKKEYFFEKKLTNLKANKDEFNLSLIDKFDISLNLYEYYQVQISGIDHEIMKLSLTLESPTFQSYKPIENQPFYTVTKYINQNLTQIRKRLNKRDGTQLNINVDVCAYFHFDVNNLFKNKFNIQNQDYIEIILTIIASYLIKQSNLIFQSINDPELSITIKLVETYVFNKNVEELNTKDVKRDDYSKELKEYLQNVEKYFDNQSQIRKKCDALLFFHNYLFGSEYSYNAGIARINNICTFYPTSLITFKPGYSMLIAVAHELAHSLGSSHVGGSFNLMNPNDAYDLSNFIVSDLTTQAIKKNLLNYETNRLKLEYSCLDSNIFNDFKYNYLIDFITPYIGYFLSYSDQCKIHFLDDSSIALNINRDNEYCQFSCKNNLNSLVSLDGSKCDLNKNCEKSKCIINDNQIIQKIKYSGSNHLITNDLILSYAFDNLRNNCPQGPSSSKSKCELNRISEVECSKTFSCCEFCLLYKKGQQLNDKFKCQSFSNNNPCFNQGICRNRENFNSKINFVCNCQNNFKGLLCLDFNPCDFKPCKPNENCYRFGELGAFFCAPKDQISGHLKNTLETHRLLKHITKSIKIYSNSTKSNSKIFTKSFNVTNKSTKYLSKINSIDQKQEFGTKQLEKNKNLIQVLIICLILFILSMCLIAYYTLKTKRFESFRDKMSMKVYSLLDKLN